MMLGKRKIKGLWFCWFLILPVLFFSMSDLEAQAATKRFSILGGQVGGSWNPWASAMSILFTKNIPGYSFSSEAGTGSPENVRRVNRGEVETGFGFSGDLYEAWRGGSIFKTPHQNLRAITKLFGSVGQVVTLASSDVKEIKDIAGKTIAMGGPNSGSALTFERFTRHLGLWGKYKPVFLGAGKAVSALGDRQVAAFNWHANVAHRVVTQASVSHKIRLIDLGTPAKESGFYDKYPYYGPRTIPAGVIKGVDKPVPSFQQSTVWTANKDVDPDVVYQMLKEMYSEANKKFLTQSIGIVFEEMTKDTAFSGITIPLHPGAERYWKEVGVSIPPKISSN